MLHINKKGYTKGIRLTIVIVDDRYLDDDRYQGSSES
jgi:hypothetical protein